ncbi:hypothetical protein R1flu_014858 [Riccia fluitans]|uniref:Uncharacterized protein n=1 Tax=Riccia fluitans TaxID=41844 RepID=A0ABD1YL28_9MARC
MPIQCILQNALVEVKGVARHFHPEQQAIWKANKDMILSWICSWESSIFLSSTSLIGSRDLHHNESRYQEINQTIDNTQNRTRSSRSKEECVGLPPIRAVSSTTPLICPLDSLLSELRNQESIHTTDVGEIQPPFCTVSSTSPRICPPKLPLSVRCNQKNTKTFDAGEIQPPIRTVSSAIPWIGPMELILTDLCNQETTQMIDTTQNKSRNLRVEAAFAGQMPNPTEAVGRSPLASIDKLKSMSEMLTCMRVNAESPKRQNRSPVVTRTSSNSWEEWWGSHRPP